ncbi:MAG: pirin family protein [Zoogloeaceae bacterium]|nr:pirin family protein [Rhodocyclaceae bacterium]MCP5239340.1 pirin family protein [Zoogloeaceae bacterium]MCP5254892.1 pirin family protein [Zoogloeaceae bacterium]MCP5295600.1 pirin family protein [Zoogloeaceae bacterium]MCW5616320.1 pirin family protein [Rhodocyclaceae bacterium]
MKTIQAQLAAEVVARPREVERTVTGVATSDGAGVKLTRVLTNTLQHRLDPFLMLDSFRSDDPNDYIAGFPAHPHRGFETVTYMIAGRMRHQDSSGGEGLLENGGVQWMTAARGVIHSEMPEQEEGVMEGFQLWLNLPAEAKMGAASYRDFPSEAIPEVRTDAGALVRVIAGRSHGVAGAVERPLTEPLVLDIHLPAGTRFTQSLPADYNAFVYVYRGEITVGAREERVCEKRMAILANRADNDGMSLRATSDARVLLVAGRPLREAIVQYGPFVMNTREEIEQALADYRDGKLAA